MIFAFVRSVFKAYLLTIAEAILPTIQQMEQIMTTKTLEKMTKNTNAYEIIRRRATMERAIAMREAWAAVFGP